MLQNRIYCSGCCVVYLVLLAVGTIAIVAVIVYQVKEVSRAAKVYQSSLDQLARNPKDPRKRMLALAMGRNLANLVNNRKGVSQADEIKIMNDLQAACAGDPLDPVPIPEIDPTLDPESVEGRLAKLNNLLALGHLSGQDYVVKRRELLGRD